MNFKSYNFRAPICIMLSIIFVSGVAKQLNPAIDILLMAAPYIFRSYINVNNNNNLSAENYGVNLSDKIQEYLILS